MPKKHLLSRSREVLGTTRIDYSKRKDNQRKILFHLTRELVNAQFNLGDDELSNRIWQEISDREIDINRVMNLMYRCSFHDDDDEMLRVDSSYMN